MIIKSFSLPGVYEITLTPHSDHRGQFMRTYDAEIFQKYDLARPWIQENYSFSKQKGTIRGLHFQYPPYSETKIIRVLNGAILDVFVDLRKESPTFGKWGSIELTKNNNKMIYIPRGFAHGFCTLTDDCEVAYKVDNSYSPLHEGGVIWNDMTLRINWPTSNPIISKKDSNLPTLKDFIIKSKDIDSELKGD